MGKLEVYPKDDPTNSKIITSTEDRKIYASIYDEFRSYISNMTMVRNDDNLEVCNIKSEYIKNNIFVPNRKQCINLNFNEVINFFSNIAITGMMNSNELH
jgi:hypothetical protein